MLLLVLKNGIGILKKMRGWRNWQTHYLEVVAPFNGHGGSSPLPRTRLFCAGGLKSVGFWKGIYCFPFFYDENGFCFFRYGLVMVFIYCKV